MGDASMRRNAGKKTARAKETRKLNQSKLLELLAHPAVKPANLPTSQRVELATLVKKAPPGDDWLHEIKFDGYRMLCRVEDGKARFISRRGLDWTHRFRELAEAASDLPVEQAMLDGEIVAVQSDGTTSFQALQNSLQSGRSRELVYYAFDILYLDRRDVTGVPVEERKEILRIVSSGSPHQSIRYSDHLRGSGPDIGELPQTSANRLQGYPSVPATRLGRLAADGAGGRSAEGADELHCRPFHSAACAS
jgi:bifunctional non-homologous end joining protein LigD